MGKIKRKKEDDSQIRENDKIKKRMAKYGKTTKSRRIWPNTQKRQNQEEDGQMWEKDKANPKSNSKQITKSHGG